MNRLTTINQYGETLYCGKYIDKESLYKNIGNYPEYMNKEAVEEVLIRLRIFEDNFENIFESIYD